MLRISISLAILPEFFIHIGYFFLKVMQENKRGCFYKHTLIKIQNENLINICNINV